MLHAPTLEAGHQPHIAITIKQLASQENKPVAEIVKLIESAKQKLLVAQQQRKLPSDDKKLAAWNALALSALLQTGLQKKHYQQAANKIHSYLINTLWDGKELPFPIVLDSTGVTMDNLGIVGYPTTVLIDPEGKVVENGNEKNIGAFLLKEN